MVDEKEDLKMAIIAGASFALKRKSKNFRKTDDEVLKEVTKNIDEILEKMDQS